MHKGVPLSVLYNRPVGAAHERSLDCATLSRDQTWQATQFGNSADCYAYPILYCCESHTTCGKFKLGLAKNGQQLLPDDTVITIPFLFLQK